MWALLIAASAAGWLSAKRRYIRYLALLPALVAYEPILSHSPLSDLVWTTGRLADRCAKNDGSRPSGFTPAMAVARYFGVTAVRPDLLLLTGERRSYWLKRSPDGSFAFEKPSRVSGNLWEGCLSGADVWLTKRGRLYRVTRSDDPYETNHETIKEFLMPDPPDISVELDFADAICDEERGSIYASEVVRGGLRELVLATGEQRRTQIGGYNLQMRCRSDGMFVGIDTNRLFVFDPERRAVIEEHGAGISTLGVDLCSRDGRVAVTDLAGIIRVFARGQSGEYSFERGALLAAPRRVAFSADCEVLGVTSGNDKTVYVLRASTLEVVKSYSLGPGLRDLTFSGPREIAAADACTATILDASLPDQ
jgi:hypothetical protein